MEPEGYDGGAELSDAETALWRAWGRARHRLTRYIDEVMEQGTGLSMGEFAALNILHGRPDKRARVSDVAARCGLSSSRVSRLADGLVHRGLAVRDRAVDDGRATFLVLTELGQRRRDESNAHQNRLARHFILDHVPPEHLDLFVEVVTAISRTEPYDQAPG